VAQLDTIIISRNIKEIPPALTFICEALAQCHHLTEVDLSSNAFGVRTVQPIASLLSTRLSLEVVKLANNGVNSESDRVVAESLVQAANKRRELSQPPTLRLLILSRNRLGDGSASALAEAISANPRLQRFEISNAGLREDGILALASALVHGHDLTRLRLRDNVIANADSREGKRGWTAISDVIRAARNLEYIDVSTCFLRDDGCQEVIDTLGEHVYARLHTIRLDTNDFGESHYARLQTVIVSTLPALRSLNLTGNEDLEGGVAVDAIGEMLANRGGNLELEDDDTANEVDEDDEDVEDEERSSKRTEEDAKVDKLADLITSNLTIKVSSMFTLSMPAKFIVQNE
jgi:Ran GTPase-activating protein 1